MADNRSPNESGATTLVLGPPSSARNLAYHGIGAAFLFLNKIRHGLQGYATPRPFAATDVRRAVAYDFAVVESWLTHLRNYALEDATLTGRTVLELGPGPDLGTGLILLAQGIRRYHAIDVNNLLPLAPPELYEELFRKMAAGGGSDVETLRGELTRTLQGQGDRLNFVCQPDFDIAAVPERGIDMVFSQAAFEHFSDVDRVIAQLSTVVKPGAILIAEVDLGTHTRWIRDVDPLNIYRYSDVVYRLARFAGAPNRLRPHEYERILAQHGWRRIVAAPLACVDPGYLARVAPKLSRRFRDSINQMHVTSIMLCATKA